MSNEPRYPDCPECGPVHPMHPWEYDGESGWRCDDCGYTEDRD